MEFRIQSSDEALLTQARRIASEFVEPFTQRGDIVGIMFLGGIARGYFDQAADIDIALFTTPNVTGPDLGLAGQFLTVEGVMVHCHVEDYDHERGAAWNMAKRWTYEQGQMVHDPLGKVAALMKEKVPLQPEERKWLLMSGIVLSQWYIEDLSELWVERGNLVSAHHMFEEGLNHLFNMLFGLNNRLVADVKWRYYAVEQLERLPAGFAEGIRSTMLLQAFTVEELQRRKGAFMGMWREMLAVIEGDLGLSFDEMVALV